MSDSELIKEFKLYQQTRLTSGPYFTQRYEVMNEDLLKQFIKTKSEASPTLIDFFRTFGRFDAGEHTNIHVDCYPRVSGSIFSGTGGFFCYLIFETICRTRSSKLSYVNLDLL